MKWAKAVILQQTEKRKQTMRDNLRTKLGIGLLAAIVVIGVASAVVRAKNAEAETRRAESAASEFKPR